MEVNKKIHQLLGALLLFTAMPLTAQVLLNEDFDSYTFGDYTTGSGGLYAHKSVSGGTYIWVAPEPGRGNILTIRHESLLPNKGTGGIRQSSGAMATLWDNRTPGNDIFKFEFEFYGSSNSTFNAGGGAGGILVDFQYHLNFERVIGGYSDGSNGMKTKHFGPNGTDSDFPHDTWIKVELFVDYTTNQVHFYIPTLNIHTTDSFSHNIVFNYIYVGAGSLEKSSLVKYDNIKVSALQTLPSYLGVSNFVSSKFNVFPNPVKDMVTITNNESIGIEQIEVFDTTGKTIKSLNFHNEKEVQINLGDFAAGMYLFHIKTNEGVVVKKVVKK